MTGGPVRPRVVEVACDESGFSGSNLLDPGTRVFAHAGVAVGLEEASGCVEVLREQSRYVAGEYKAARLVRQRPVLRWLLGGDGPLLGRAAVQLTDKYFLLAGRLSALAGDGFDYRSGTSLDPDRTARRAALALHTHGPRYGEAWWDLLRSLLELLRSRNRFAYDEHVEAFLATAARFSPDEAEPAALIRQVLAGRSRLEPLRDRLFDDRTLLPPLEVLIPALLETTLHWYAGAEAVAVVHDEQSALTVHRIAQLNRVLAGDRTVLTLVQADSRADPRVQLADLLAGSARQIATTELHGRGDPELTALLRPYLTPHPIWADDASWHRLTRAEPQSARSRTTQRGANGTTVPAATSVTPEPEVSSTTS